MLLSSAEHAQVNARANQLAHHLIANGTTLGSAVGLMLEPSIDAVIAMLAVLKAGCCYVPLLQHYSDAAVELIADDASLSEVLVHRGLQRRLPKDQDLRVFELDDPDEAAMIQRRPTRSPGRRAAPVDAAYVLFFQAADAARPTGIVHQHAGLADMIAGLSHVAGGTLYGAAEPPTVALASPLTEHAAVLEVWAPLTQGGTLVVLQPEDEFDVASFVDSLAEARVTAAYFTAETLKRAASMLTSAADTLRCIWVSEPVDEGLANAVFEALPDAALTLGYGLLEATPFVVAAVLHKGDELVGEPIGRPLLNMRVCLCASDHPGRAA